jgi:hypothetical protein
MTSTTPERDPDTKVALTTTESVGRLRIRRGLDGVELTADPTLDDLLHGWWRREPEVTTDGGDVTVSYPRRWWPRWAPQIGNDDIALNTSVPWEISVEGGLHRVGADLSLLKLRSFKVHGAASRLALVLGKPDREVHIDLEAADRVTIRRPRTVEVRVRIASGASQVAVDDQTYNAIGGETVVNTGPVLGKAYFVNVRAARRLRVTTI